MDRFRDGSVIGEGGFCEVRQCIRLSDQEAFAKKVLKLDTIKDNVERFRKEVRILSSLDHPNVIRVLEKSLQKSPFYYIMPLYKHTLRSILEELIGDENRIQVVFTSVLNGVEYAHSQGVLHRDLKPENILMNSDDDLVVSDFGLGRVIDADSSRLTQTGFGMGTPWYRAPEQFNMAKYADKRADVFALGRMLYELYTAPLLSGIQDTSRLPSGIGFIVNRCTRDDPNDRFQSVGDLKSAWYSIRDTVVRESELDELIHLRGVLSAPDTGSSQQVTKLLELLAIYQDDADLLHDTIMIIHHTVIHAMYRINASLVTTALKRFLDHAAGTGWGFDYTDKIARQCKNIYTDMTDCDIRAIIVESLMTLGVEHNRFNVLQTFAELIQGQLIPGEEIALVDRLQMVDDRTRRKAAGYVNIEKLHPLVRPFLEF